MTEEWRVITEFPAYEVSDEGCVRRSAYGKKPAQVLKPATDHKGYKRVCLTGVTGKKSVRVHRLVLMTFTRSPTVYEEANHVDGVKSNNAVTNLEWVTPSANVIHAFAMGLIPSKAGEHNGRAKLTWPDVREIRRLRDQCSRMELARRFGVSNQLISQIQLNQIWHEELAL